MRIATGLLALLPIVASAQTAPPTTFPESAAPVTAEALRERLAGKVFRATLHDGSTWRLEYKTNGYAFIDVGNGFRDTGNWRVEDGKLCGEWRRVTGGCNEVRVGDDAVYIKRMNGEVVALKTQ